MFERLLAHSTPALIMPTCVQCSAKPAQPRDQHGVHFRPRLGSVSPIAPPSTQTASFCGRQANLEMRLKGCAHNQGLDLNLSPSENALRICVPFVLQHLHNTFLVVTRASAYGADADNSSCIVDPFFRSSFELSCSCSTVEYEAALPFQEEIVGTLECLLEVPLPSHPPRVRSPLPRPGPRLLGTSCMQMLSQRSIFACLTTVTDVSPTELGAKQRRLVCCCDDVVGT